MVGVLMQIAPGIGWVAGAAAGRRLPPQLVEANVMIHCVGALLADWNLAATPGSGRVWMFSVVLIDMALVFGTPPRTPAAVILLTVGWLVCCATEDAARWGLYRVEWAAPAPELYHRRVGCAAPPCATGWLTAAEVLAYRITVFLLDYSDPIK